jgi:DNA-binding transcriptional LysR family regulator
LRDLARADWLTTSITERSEDELAPLFRQHGLGEPRIAVQARTAMTTMISIVYSDLLAMLPVQWVESKIFADAIEVIEVEEVLRAPAIGIVRRATLPLTPAAEHFCDLIRRAANHVASKRKKSTGRAHR